MRGEVVFRDRLVRAAALDNAAWCDAVCRAHGLPTSFGSTSWACLRRSPPLYPDAVTLVPGARAEQVLAPLEAGPGCSVKDCWADVDLAPSGFDLLIQGVWVARRPAPAPVHRPWSLVDTPEALATWAAGPSAPATFPPALLVEPQLRFVELREAGAVVAGAALSLTAVGADQHVVGVSNVFCGSVDPGAVWSSAVGAAGALFPGVPLVGWVHDVDLGPAAAVGFEPLAALRVWLRGG